MAAPSPLQSSSDKISLVIRATGQPLPQSWQVIAVDVWSAVGQPSRARLVMADGDMPTATFPVSDSNGLAPGVTLEVALGYDGANAQVFSGTILRQEIEITANATRLIVEAQGGGAISGGPVALCVTWGTDMQAFRATGDARDTMQGEVTYPGSALAKAGDRITLAGVSNRFSGDVMISRLPTGFMREIGARSRALAPARPLRGSAAAPPPTTPHRQWRWQ